MRKGKGDPQCDEKGRKKRTKVLNEEIKGSRCVIEARGTRMQTGKQEEEGEGVRETTHEERSIHRTQEEDKSQKRDTQTCNHASSPNTHTHKPTREEEKRYARPTTTKEKETRNSKRIFSKRAQKRAQVTKQSV